MTSMPIRHIVELYGRFGQHSKWCESGPFRADLAKEVAQKVSHLPAPIEGGFARLLSGSFLVRVQPGLQSRAVTRTKSFNTQRVVSNSVLKHLA